MTAYTLTFVNDDLRRALKMAESNAVRVSAQPADKRLRKAAAAYLADPNNRGARKLLLRLAAERDAE